MFENGGDTDDGEILHIHSPISSNWKLTKLAKDDRATRQDSRNQQVDHVGQPVEYRRDHESSRSIVTSDHSQRTGPSSARTVRPERAQELHHLGHRQSRSAGQSGAYGWKQGPPALGPARQQTFQKTVGMSSIDSVTRPRSHSAPADRHAHRSSRTASLAPGNSDSMRWPGVATLLRDRSQSAEEAAADADEEDFDDALEISNPAAIYKAVLLPQPRLSQLSPRRKPQHASADHKGKMRAVNFNDSDDVTSMPVSRSGQKLMQELGDDSSMRRVLLEGEESRRERESWSDSAAHVLGERCARRIESLSSGTGSIRRRKGDSKSHDRQPSASVTESPSSVNKKSSKKKRGIKHQERDQGVQPRILPSEQQVGPARQHTTFRPVVCVDSPPIAHSFDPFAQLGRKLSLGRSQTKRRRRPSDTDGFNGHSGCSRRDSIDISSTRRLSDATSDSPRFVGGKPIRHVRTSNSVDSLSLHSRSTQLAAADHIGEAVTTASPPAIGPLPVLSRQNAAVSLPPHLHHLLRTPPRQPGTATRTNSDNSDFLPHRSAPPVPGPVQTKAGGSDGSNSTRASGISQDSSAALAVALGARLDLEADERLRASRNASEPPRRPSLEPRPATIERVRLADDSPKGTAISTAFPGPPSSPAAQLPTGRSLLDSTNIARRTQVSRQPPKIARSSRLTNLASAVSSNNESASDWRESFPHREGRRKVTALDSLATIEDDPTRVSEHRLSGEADSVSLWDSSDFGGTLDDDGLHIDSFESLFFHPPQGSSLPRIAGVGPPTVTRNQPILPVYSTSLRNTVSEIGGWTRPEPMPSNGARRPLHTVSQGASWAATSFAREYLDSIPSSRNSDVDQASFLDLAFETTSPVEHAVKENRTSFAHEFENEPRHSHDMDFATPESCRAESQISFIEEWSPPDSPEPEDMIYGVESFRGYSLGELNPEQNHGQSSFSVANETMSPPTSTQAPLLAVSLPDDEKRASSGRSGMSVLDLDEFPCPPSPGQVTSSRRSSPLILDVKTVYGHDDRSDQFRDERRSSRRRLSLSFLEVDESEWPERD